MVMKRFEYEGMSWVLLNHSYVTINVIIYAIWTWRFVIFDNHVDFRRIVYAFYKFFTAISQIIMAFFKSMLSFYSMQRIIFYNLSNNLNCRLLFVFPSSPNNEFNKNDIERVLNFELY